MGKKITVPSSREPQATAAIWLMLVDDHPVIRVGIANQVSLNTNVLVVAQVNDAASAIGLWRKHRPDVCLLNATVELMGGIETTKKIVAAFPEACVLMLTSSCSPREVSLAMRAGAIGCLPKTIGRKELVQAIQGACRRTLSTKLFPAASVRPASGSLSQRKLDVLGLIRRGFTNDSIARALGIEERTVRFHITEMLAILGASDRAQAVAIGFERGLLELSSRNGGAS